MHFQANTPRVIHETIDGETIVIDLTTGTYFSLRDVAACVWAEVSSRAASSAEVAQAVAAAFDAPAEVIEAEVARFLGDLEAEHLIVAASTESAGEAPVREPASALCAFSPPRVEKYTDMQDIILLDPVHEVGAAGWPQAAAAG